MLQFVNGTDLGTVRASNNQVIGVTAYDSLPFTGPVVYSLTEGTVLPDGLSLDPKVGYLYGFIPYQPAYVRKYTIGIVATKTITTSNAVINVINTFTLAVKGEVESSIEWVTTSNLGSIETGITSELAVVAKQLNSNYTIKYNLTAGSLPNGLTLEQDGSISGKITHNHTGTYTFTVLASDVYELSAIDRTFTLTAVQSDTKKYTEIYFKPFFSKQKREDYRTFITNEFTFDPKLLYRYFDPNFGVQHDIKLVVEFGIEQLNLANYLPALSKNFYKKRFYFGDVKKAIAVDNAGTTIYEIVYIDPVDDMVNNSGISVTDTGADYYPSVDNMRNHLELLMSGDSVIGVNEYNKPKFMRTPQVGDYKPPTYMRVIPLCYALPGQGDKIISRIKLSGFNFKLLDFEVDRLIVQESADNATAKYLMLEGQAL